MSRMRTPVPRERGFTIVELLVAMTGAMFLSVGVFMVAKHTTGLYQEETRAANANMGSIIGFERFRADLARAGFMSSPNALTDSRICAPVPDATWPQFMQQMQSVRFAVTADLPAVFASNGLAPQEVILSGNFSSAEALPIRTVVNTGTTYIVYLQVASGPMARLGYSTAGANQSQILNNTFPPGRAVRIVDRAGRHYYGIIQNTQAAPEPAVVLTGPTPRLQFRDTSALGCGITGNETGATINTVNFIRYRIGSLQDVPRFAPLFAAAAQGPFDGARTELIREELDPDGEVFEGTEELIAEYAVDLHFEITVQSNPANALLRVENADLYTWAGDPEQRLAGRGPQFVRTIHSWLSVRSRVADRDANITVAAGPKYRIGLGAAGGAPFARVRTIQSRTALHNQ